MKLDTLIGEPWADYGLVDSGNGRKLERYGRYRFIRPEPQALWAPARPTGGASGEFVPGSDEDGGGQWHFAEPTAPRRLAAGVGRRRASPRRPRPSATSASSPTWRRCGAGCASGIAGAETPGMPQPVRLHRRRHAGARRGGRADGPCRRVEEVGRGGARQRAPVRARRRSRYAGWSTTPPSSSRARCRRGRRYDGILLDPPKYGRGPEGEVWRLEEHLPALIADCRRLLDADSRFLFLTVYAVRMSALAIGEMVAPGLRRPARPRRGGRTRRARGSARPGPADRDLGTLVAGLSVRRSSPGGGG